MLRSFADLENKSLKNRNFHFESRHLDTLARSFFLSSLLQLMIELIDLTSCKVQLLFHNYIIFRQTKLKYTRERELFFQSCQKRFLIFRDIFQIIQNFIRNFKKSSKNRGFFLKESKNYPNTFYRNNYLSHHFSRKSRVSHLRENFLNSKKRKSSTYDDWTKELVKETRRATSSRLREEKCVGRFKKSFLNCEISSRFKRDQV